MFGPIPPSGGRAAATAPNLWPSEISDHVKAPFIRRIKIIRGFREPLVNSALIRSICAFSRHVVSSKGFISFKITDHQREKPHNNALI